LKELIGAVVAVVSALMYDAGYVLEKQALADLPMGQKPLALVRVAAANRRWLGGFIAMAGGLGLQVVALTLAPVSVVQPILAGGLIALAAAGSSLLGERLNVRHGIALALVVAAVVAVAASARGTAPLATHVPGGRLVLLAAVAVILAGVAIQAGVTRNGERGASRGAGRLGASGLAGTAVAAGLLYGLGAVAEKAVSTRLVSRGVIDGALSSLATPYPWLFLATTLAGMVVFQVGLQAHPASLMASLTNITSTVCALVGASVVFGEGWLPGHWWSLLRLTGYLCVLAAVGLLAVDGQGGPISVADARTRPDHAVAP
jgi:multidrug transporter EmrE-like cation transporter